jgi:hypothetical protein
MATFTSVAFSGPIVASPRNFGWCPISSIKAAIIFTGWTGATVGAGTRKLFVQMVYFNGKNAPTFGPVSAIASPLYTGDLFPNICDLGNSRLLVTYLESATSFSYSVVNIDVGDKCYVGFKHGAVQTIYYGECGIPMAKLANDKVVACHNLYDPAGASTLKDNYAIVDVGPTSLSVSATLLNYSRNVYSDGWTGTSDADPIVGHAIRTAKDGSTLIARTRSYTLNGVRYGTYITTFNAAGFAEFGAINNGTGIDAVGKVKQQGRDALPLDVTNIVMLGASGADGTSSTTGGSKYEKIALPADPATIWATAVGSYNPYRDSAICKFDDAIWLDDSHFFALATLNAGMQYPLTTAFDTNAYQQVGYIGRYDEPSNGIIAADSFPVQLPTFISPSQYDPRVIHKIDATTVALIQCVKNQTSQNFELNITVVGA